MFLVTEVASLQNSNGVLNLAESFKSIGLLKYFNLSTQFLGKTVTSPAGENNDLSPHPQEMPKIRKNPACLKR